MKAEVKEIVTASLLGDGWLTELKPRTGTAMYYVKYHGRSRDYLQWLHGQVRELGPSELKEVARYGQYYFYTKARTDIGELRKLFYPNEGRKVIPRNIRELLSTPKALAIWYQDDGTLDKRSRDHWNAMFATYCFGYEECELLAKTLKDNFDLAVSVCRCQMRGKMYYRLYVRSQSMNNFIRLVQPHIHPSFSYKISLNNGQQQR